MTDKWAITFPGKKPEEFNADVWVEAGTLFVVETDKCGYVLPQGQWTKAEKLDGEPLKPQELQMFTIEPETSQADDINVTSPDVAKLAAKGLKDPKSLTDAELKSVFGSALAQARG